MKRIKKYVVTSEILSKISKNDLKTIKKIRKIIKKDRVMSPKIKEDLNNLGLVLVFRGFNSHSQDEYIYKYNFNNKWYYSVGVANIAQAGRGFQFQLDYFKISEIEGGKKWNSVKIVNIGSRHIILIWAIVTL